jgi:hypothetical protein
VNSSLFSGEAVQRRLDALSRALGGMPLPMRRRGLNGATGVLA